MAIAKLIVKFLGDDKALKQSYRNAEKSGDKFVKKTKNQFSGLKSSVSKALAGIAAAASIGGIGSFTKGVAESARELKSWSDTLNIGVLQLQRWQFAANTVGIGTEKLTDIFKDVNDKLGDFALTGGGEAAEVLKKLGFSARDFKNLKADEALLKIGQAVGTLGTQERIFVLEAIANDLSKLSPLLTKNGEQLKKLSADFDTLGIGIEEKTVTKFSKLGGALNRTGAILKGFGVGLIEGIIPPINSAVDALGSLVGALGGAQNIGKKVSETLVAAFGRLKATVDAVLSGVSRAADIAKKGLGKAGEIFGGASRGGSFAGDVFNKVTSTMKGLGMGFPGGESATQQSNLKFSPKILSREGLTSSGTDNRSSSTLEKFRTGPNSFGNASTKVKIELSATPELQEVIKIKKGQTSFSDVDIFTTNVAQQVSE